MAASCPPGVAATIGWRGRHHLVFPQKAAAFRCSIYPKVAFKTGQGNGYFRIVCRQSISDSWLGNLRECLAHLVKGSGCDCLLMQAASLLDGFSFDLFPPFENGLAAPEVDVSRRQVVQALVVSTVVVVADELLDAVFELSWQVVVVQQDPVFHRAMISLDLALRHRVVRPAADMSDAVVLEPLAKLARHVGWTVIAQQPWPMQNLDLVQT